MLEITRRLDELKIKYSYNKGAMKISYKKGVIYGLSYENIEACRGFTNIDTAICDEIALAPSDFLPTMTFCMRGEGIKPHIYAMSTPRAASWWNRYLIQNAEDMDIIRATMMDNKFLTDETIKLVKGSCLDESMLRQEMYGEIVDDNSSGVLFTSHDLKDSSISYFTNTFSIGCDCSGYGKDNNVLVLRKGNELLEVYKIQKATGSELFNKIYAWIMMYGIENCSGIFIDEAYGDKLYERCLDASYPAFIVPFGGKPEDGQFNNKRTEIYCKLSRFIKENTMIGLDENLKYELSSTKYVLNDRNKIALIPKDEIKEIIGHSPDSADALALTFAMSDVPRGISIKQKFIQKQFLGD